jgi:hypothetical protein
MFEVTGSIAPDWSEGQGACAEHPFDQTSGCPLLLRSCHLEAIGAELVIKGSSVAFTNRLLNQMLDKRAVGGALQCFRVMCIGVLFRLQGMTVRALGSADIRAFRRDCKYNRAQKPAGSLNSTMHCS